MTPCCVGGIPVAGDGAVQERVDERLRCLHSFGKGPTALEAEHQGGGARVLVVPVGARHFEGAGQSDINAALAALFRFLMNGLAGGRAVDLLRWLISRRSARSR